MTGLLLGVAELLCVPQTPPETPQTSCERIRHESGDPCGGFRKAFCTSFRKKLWIDLAPMLYLDRFLKVQVPQVRYF